MGAFQLVTDNDIARFNAAVAKHGRSPADFEIQEEAFDQAKAEVETALGEVGVKRIANDAVEAYPLGPGRDWVADFDADLRAGKFD
jgi:hypothetical protein